MALLLVIGAGGALAQTEPAYRDQPPRRPQVRRDYKRFPREAPRSHEAVSGPHDALGYYRQSKRYAAIVGRGIQVVDLPADEAFFVYWLPPEKPLSHVLVLLHGTGGTAYDELADELDLAQARGFAVVSLQWLNKRTLEYADGSTVARWLDAALRLLEERTGTTAGRVGISGFSRGAAVSYETAYQDRLGAKRVSFVIAHSGGIPTDYKVARDAPGPNRFFSDLDAGALGAAYDGVSFFMYAGCKDEQWGSTMCAYVRNAERLVKRAGGTVAACIIDEEGGHAGYVKTPAYHERAINLFLETSE